MSRSDTAFIKSVPLLQAAYDFASRAHADQKQDTDATPYIDHAVEVGGLLSDTGFPDHVVAAGLLHDVVEKTDVTHARIRARFGPRVGDLVAAMTEPDAVEDYEERKAALREQIVGAGDEAEAIFAADKTCNTASLREALAHDGTPALRARLDNPLEQKIDHYRATLELLEEVGAAVPFLPRLRAELDQLQHERPEAFA